MFIYYCEECGKKCEAKYKSTTRRFCSHKCANIHNKRDKEKAVTTFICLTCGKPFEVKNGDSRIKNKSVKFCSRECSAQHSKVGEDKACPVCGKIFYTTRRKTCGVECGRVFRSSNWEHKAYKENGYIVEYQKGYNKKSNVKQHRKIIEEKLGRRLLTSEVIHHINGDKTDNRLENLAVMSRSEHSSLHRKAEKAAGKHLFGGYHNN